MRCKNALQYKNKGQQEIAIMLIGFDTGTGYPGPDIVSIPALVPRTF
jgi:hypothetical protein